MSDVSLTLAISDYDHVRDLTTGRVRPEGIDLVCLDMIVEEIFYRFARHREWEVSEMSFGLYTSIRASGDDSITAIPVFPSRVLRQSSVYVRAGGSVERPEDLAGRRIGIPEWAQTAGIYARGWLTDDIGLDLAGIDWVQAGVNEPGRIEKVALSLPAGVSIRAEPERTLDAMLHAGEIDAMITAHPPDSFKAGDPGIRRLFEDYVPVEREYWQRTGVFPIMHVVALRRDALDRHPWIAMNLLTAFEQAKARSMARVREITAPRVPIPWCFAHADAAVRDFGADYWPYGIEPNRTTIESFLRWGHEQGVCARRLTVEEIFADQVQGRFAI